MTIKDLEKEEDKMAIFRDFNVLKQYIVTVKDLLDAMALLNDNEKLEVMKLDYFQRQATSVKARVAMEIKDEKVKSQIIRDLPLMEAIFDDYNFKRFLETLNDESKMYVLKNSAILKKFNMAEYDIKQIIQSMSNENRVEILSNKALITELGIGRFDLNNLIIGIQGDEDKYKLAKEYELNEFDIIGVIKSFSDENRKRIILEDKEGFQNYNIVSIISTFGTEEVIDFINNKQEFLASKGIRPFEIIKKMTSEKQLELIGEINRFNLPEKEKRIIFAALENKVKRKIDVERVDEKYRKLLEIELYEDFPQRGMIIPKLDEDISQYRDLDELISINPLQMLKNDEDREKMLQLCRICPNMEIEDNLIIGNSTPEEYIKGEEWINFVLQGIQQEWTDVQKLAYIDTEIGKKISYTPEFGTEAEESEDARALWKIISNGYGVCNGIAQVEQYLLGRIGIESELVSSKTHTFVKVKSIKIPTENGILEGDTLVDPTWNLTASRYGARPNHFCKSYEELRKEDIDIDGKDHECHKNEELEQSTTINMDTKTLREVYKSIGVADKEGNFPIGKLIEQARQIDENSANIQSNINSKFALLKKWCPEFATCQNSTIDALRDVLFENNENFSFRRCIASRVYDRTDEKKQAVLYIYMELPNIGKQFFYADKVLGEFIQMSQEEFEKKFECYEADMQRLPEHKRPWETEVEIQEKKENSSGKVVAEEGR